MKDLQAAFDAGFEAVKSYIDREMSSFDVRLKELERRAPEPGAAGRDGVDGKDGSSVTLDDVAPLLERAVSGKVEEALRSIPKPKDGRDGADGITVTIDDIRPLVASAVDLAMASVSIPKDGKDGRDGVDGKDGVDGAPGKDGIDGKDGADVASALIDRDGNLVLTLSNGVTKTLGRVVGLDGAPGRDGADGAPGKDGFSLKNFDAALMEDGRTVVLKFEDGSDTSFAVELGFPAMIYRGVFAPGAYQKGDTVTYGGSLWHSNEDGNTHKPDDGSKAWTLAAKRGRDAREPAKV